MIAYEIIENKYPDKDGYIAYELYIAPADQPVKKASTYTKKAHHCSENHGQYGCPDTQAQGGKHSLHDKTAYPPGFFRVESNKILGYYAPAPLIMDFYIDPVNKPGKD